MACRFPNLDNEMLGMEILGKTEFEDVVREAIKRGIRIGKS
jgi:hypothetical protein